MIDWLTKELIYEYTLSNIDEDRSCIKSERINGRLYDKHGVDCATTLVAFEYKVFDPSNKTYKFAFLVGIARQNPGDTQLDMDEGYEIASIKALTNPSLVIIYDREPGTENIKNLFKSYIYSLPIKFVKTKSELLLEGKDVNKFNRGNKNNYYENYYKDYKKYFWNK